MGPRKTLYDRMTGKPQIKIIGGKECQVKYGKVKVSDLTLSGLNPRIQAALLNAGLEPSKDLDDESILIALMESADVGSMCSKIKQNAKGNGTTNLLEPVLANANGLVFEGATRTAATRLLSEEDKRFEEIEAEIAAPSVPDALLQKFGDQTHHNPKAQMSVTNRALNAFGKFKSGMDAKAIAQELGESFSQIQKYLRIVPVLYAYREKFGKGKMPVDAWEKFEAIAAAIPDERAKMPSGIGKDKDTIQDWLFRAFRDGKIKDSTHVKGNRRLPEGVTLKSLVHMPNWVAAMERKDGDSGKALASIGKKGKSNHCDIIATARPAIDALCKHLRRKNGQRVIGHPYEIDQESLDRAMMEVNPFTLTAVEAVVLFGGPGMAKRIYEILTPYLTQEVS